MTGQLSLTGRMWSVDGFDEKLEGVARAGLKKAILPPFVEEEGLIVIPDGVEVARVSTVFEAINHMVLGAWSMQSRSCCCRRSSGNPSIHHLMAYDCGHCVTGCSRKLVSRGGYPWLPDLVVVNTVMQTSTEHHWLRHIEVAAVPGSGQVCIRSMNGLLGP